MVWPIFSSYGDSRLSTICAAGRRRTEPTCRRPRSAQPSRTEETREPAPAASPPRSRAKPEPASSRQRSGARCAAQRQNSCRVASLRARESRPMETKRDAGRRSSTARISAVPEQMAEAATHPGRANHAGAQPAQAQQQEELQKKLSSRACARSASQQLRTRVWRQRAGMDEFVTDHARRRRCRSRAQGDDRRTFDACGRRPRQVPALRREPRQAGGRRAGVHVLGGRRYRFVQLRAPRS